MPTILVIDDDVALLARLSTQLTESGYRVVSMGDLASAEQQIVEQQPDMILLDIDTQHGAGWALLERVATRIPVIIISGQALEEHVIRGLDAGAVDFVSKPFRTGELLARMRIRLVPPHPLVPIAQVEAPPLSLPPSPVPQSAPRSRGRQRAEKDEEPIFIPYHEEHRLLHESAPAPEIELRPEELEQLPIGQRLHAARQRRRITLVQAELESKIRMHYIQAMEEEKFSLLPRGAVAGDLLRTYAAYLGLNVSLVVDEYQRLHYSSPVEPPTALGGAARQRTVPRWAIRLVAIVLALLIGFGGLWQIDPLGMQMLAGRARALVVPPAATATPTATLLPTPTMMPTPMPTPTPTNAPTITPVPTLDATITPTHQPSPTPRRRR